MIVPLITITLMLTAPIMGTLFDRLDRVTGVIIAFSLSSIGYFFFGSISDPLANTVFAAAIIVGLGEGACIMSSIALVGQNAPEKTRGSVIGTFTACGAFGMLLASGIGGVLFDKWTYTGPFLFMGAINLLVLIFAIYVKSKHGRPQHV
jgi:MFS family permease